MLEVNSSTDHLGLLTSSGVDDLHTGGRPLSQDGVFRIFEDDSEGLVVLLQSIICQVNVPGFHTDAWNKTENKAWRGCRPGGSETEARGQTQTWVKLDQSGCAVSEVSARFG